MRTTFMSLVALLLLFSCTNKKEEFYQNSNLKRQYYLKNGKIDGIYLEYFENGNLKEKHLYNLGVKVDTSYFYFDNDSNGVKIKIDNSLEQMKKASFYFPTGELKAKGILDSTNVKVGKWLVFHKNGEIDKIIEYFNINQKEYVNQTWKYSDGEINNDKGHFFEMQISKDTVQVNEDIKVLFNLSRPLFSAKSEVYVLIPREDNELRSDFSNFNEVKKDTFLSLNKEGRSTDFDKYNLSVAFSLSYEKRGIKRIRGVLVEKTDEGFLEEKDSLKFEERYLYFNKEVFVKGM